MIIYNKIIPFKGFSAMATWPIIWVRGKKVSKTTLNHEKIHFAQQKELWLVGFYLLYFIYWLKFGYRNIPFEREAYDNQRKYTYLDKREKFAWRKYLT